MPFRACLAKTAKQELTRDEVILRSCLRGSKCDLSFSSLSGAIWVVVWAAKVFSLSQRWGACCLQLEIAPPLPDLYGTVNTWAKWIKWGGKGKSLVFPGVVGCAFRPFTIRANLPAPCPFRFSGRSVAEQRRATKERERLGLKRNEVKRSSSCLECVAEPCCYLPRSRCWPGKLVGET